MTQIREPRKTTRDLVADALRARIVRNELAAGSRLSVPEIADEFGVSQTPAREALQLLEGEGMVQIDAYRGGRVAELNLDDCEEIYVMRAALEGFAARLGTEAAGAAELDEMAQHLEQMHAAAKRAAMDDFVDSDRAFHKVHYLAAGRPTLWRKILSLRRVSERYTRAIYYPAFGGMDWTLESHATLFELVKAGDAAGAEQFTREDLLKTHVALRKLLGAVEPL